MRELLDEESKDKKWWDFIDECKRAIPATATQSIEEERPDIRRDRGSAPFSSRTDDERWAALWSALEGCSATLPRRRSRRVELWARASQVLVPVRPVLLDRGIDACRFSQAVSRTAHRRLRRGACRASRIE
jgi:hypothetical protein